MNMIHGLGEPCGLLGDASSSCTWWRLPLRTHYKRPPEILRTVPEKRAKWLSHDCPERQSAACTPYWRLTSLRRKLSSRRRSSEQKKSQFRLFFNFNCHNNKLHNSTILLFSSITDFTSLLPAYSPLTILLIRPH